MSRTNIDRQMKSLEVTEDLQVKVTFQEIVTLPPHDHPENESTIIDNEYKVKSRYAPHADLMNALKKLKKFALDINEMEVSDKTKGDYKVSQVKIAGDVLLKQSRVTMTISKLVPRTGKVIDIPVGQTTMYGESDYHDAEKMSVIIEELIEEVWLYLGGKYELEGQLALFSPLQLEAL